MTTIAILLSLLALGGAVGYIAPAGSRFLRICGKCVTPMVYLLLLVLGIHLGTQGEVLQQLPKLGLNALLITLGSVCTCILLCRLTQSWFLKGGAPMRERDALAAQGRPQKGKSTEIPFRKRIAPILGSLSFLATFLVGLLIGAYLPLPALLTHDKLAEWVLYPFMILVGISIGSDREARNGMRTLSPRYLLLPALTVLATALGAWIVSLFLHHLTPIETQAVAAGYGYYSLSSIIIGNQHSAMVGAVALISNIFRELIAILLAPLIAKLGGGHNAPISVAGATSMDTSLPFIVQVTAPQYTVLSLYHGIVLSTLTPVAVSFFLRFV